MSDQELEILRRKKLQQLKRLAAEKAKMEAVKTQEEGSKQVLNRFFIDRAWEVFNAARAQYPQVAEEIEKTLVKLIQEGKIKGKISGEELYGLFIRLGFRIHLETRIRVLEHGKVKSLEEKIKEETA